MVLLVSLFATRYYLLHSKLAIDAEKYMVWKENPYRVRRSRGRYGFSFHTMYFSYQVANLLCNEFITSKTFL